MHTLITLAQLFTYHLQTFMFYLHVHLLALVTGAALVMPTLAAWVWVTEDAPVHHATHTPARRRVRVVW